MIRVLPILAALALAIYCLVECVQTDRRTVRYLPKAMWLVLMLVPVIGPVAWLVAGRPRPAGPTKGQPRPVARRPPGPRAPDDDPEFLAHLDERRLAARDDDPDVVAPDERPRADPDSAPPESGLPPAETDEDPEPRRNSGS